MCPTLSSDEKNGVLNGELSEPSEGSVVHLVSKCEKKTHSPPKMKKSNFLWVFVAELQLMGKKILILQWDYSKKK